LSRTEVQAVLFDSGDTLLTPIGGTWWPPPALLRVLDEVSPRVEQTRLAAALDREMHFLDTHHHLQTEDEEIAQFKEYNAIVLSELGVRVSEGTMEELVRASVVGQEPFADTQNALEEIRSIGIRLGIVSNAWPSLERTYRVLGLREFFDVFVISAKLGCRKPDERIYRAAIEEIGIEPSLLLFVDDDAEYVRAAERLGMRGVVMCRYSAKSHTANAVSSLAELMTIIEAR
jgi:putative hydrolase of the HAD superfamily